MDTSARLKTIIARAIKPETKRLLQRCLSKPTRADWLAAEKAAWGDVPLDTNDCLWIRSQGLALPGKGSRAEDTLND